MASEHREFIKIALSNGIPRSTFINRVKAGYTPEESCLKGFKRKTKPGRGFTVCSEFERKLSEENGISKSKFYSRIRCGWHPMDAATDNS